MFGKSEKYDEVTEEMLESMYTCVCACDCEANGGT